MTPTTFFQTIARLPMWFACLSLFALMVMTFCDVILRSSFDAPIEAATELTRIFVAVMVFAVMPQISVTSGHIAVDLTDDFFDKTGLSRLRDGLIYLACAAMLYWPVMQVWRLSERTRGYGDVTQYLGFPQHVVMFFIAFCISITALALAVMGAATLFAPSFLKRSPS